MTGPTAFGDRSVAADQINGDVFTGDGARSVKLAPGSLPDPSQVPMPTTLWNVPRPPSRVFVGRDAVMEQL
ncbi:MAG TPA: tetratricopeptide repeat protein, partial [Actinoplanes sp.]